MNLDSQLKKLKQIGSKALSSNLLWLGLLVFSLLLPTVISADFSMRIVLLIAFLAIFSKYQARIILVYILGYSLFQLLTNNFSIPEYEATQLFIYLSIYLCVLIIEPTVNNLHDSLTKEQQSI